MRQKENRNKMFAVMVLLTGLFMAFTFASAENAEIVDASALNEMITRHGSLISARNDTLPPEYCPINSKTKANTTPATFKLPSSLKTIQDEAFEGTALVVADLSGTSVEEIGERAFANIPTLIGVRIPEETRMIARTAFAGSDHVTLTGTPGGYTRAWAKENGIPFAPITTFTANTRTVQSASISIRRSNPLQTGLPTDNEAKVRNNSQRKIIGEIRDSRCQEGVAYHIQGRAPPARG